MCNLESAGVVGFLLFMLAGFVFGAGFTIAQRVFGK